MNQKQVNNFQVYLFILMANGFFINLIAFRHIINAFSQNAWYIPLIFYLVYLLMIIPYKSMAKKRNLLKETRPNKIINSIIILYCFITVLLTIFFCSLAIKDFFYSRTPIWFFILSITICSLYLSSKNFTTIIQTASIFLFISLLLYIIPIIDIFKRPLLNVLPFRFEYKKLYLGFLLLIFPFDNMLLGLHNSHLKDGLTKKMTIINGGLTFIFISYILFDSISLVGYQYFKTLLLGGLFRWQVFSSNAVFENNDIFLLYMMSVGVIFKSGFYFNTIRLILYPKDRRKTIVFIGIIFIIANYFLYSHLENIVRHTVYIRYFLLGLISIIFVYIIIQSRKVNKNE